MCADLSMTEDAHKALVARPSAAVGKISAGAEGALSRIVSDALVLARARASSLASARFRVGDYEFREADYRQILLWAKALENTPEKIIQTLKETTVDVEYTVDNEDVMPAGEIALQVEDGSISSVAWDCDELPLTEFVWAKDLKIREIAFIGWHIRFAPRFSCELPTLPIAA